MTIKRGGLERLLSWLLFWAMAILGLGAVIIILWILAAPLGASTQLSHGQAFSDVYFNNTLPQISPDGRYAVYVQDAVTDNAYELWSVRLAGGNPVRLSDPLTPGQAVAFQISGGGQPTRVVYVVDQDVPTQLELYSIPIDGSAPRVQLNPEMPAGRRVSSFRVSPTGFRVFYTSDQATVEMSQLYSVPIAGGAAVRLNASLPSDWDVMSFQVSPDGGTVVYSPGRDATGDRELWSVTATGGAAHRINRPLDDGPVGYYVVISADSASVTYEQRTSPKTYWRVPIHGGESVPASPPVQVPPPTSLTSPDGTWLVYGASAGGIDELWSVPQFGLPRKINGPLVLGGDVVLTRMGYPAYSVGPDGARVLYMADQTVNDRIDLYLAPITGIPSLIFADGFESGGTGGWT